VVAVGTSFWRRIYFSFMGLAIMTREKSEHIAEQIAAQTKKVTAGQISLELREIPSPTLTMRSATTQQVAFLLATPSRGTR
jgi:hypothetical protein